MAATNEQVQAWSDQRTRPLCETLRDLINTLADDNASFPDVYANLNGSPDWTDGRSDYPPHLLTPSDVLAINTIVYNLNLILSGSSFADTAAKASAVDEIQAQLALIPKACVRPVNS